MLRAKDLWKQEDERKTAKMQAMRPVLWVATNLSLVISWIKPQNQAPRIRAPPKSGADYRPFVYDDSAMNFLQSRMR